MNLKTKMSFLIPAMCIALVLSCSGQTWATQNAVPLGKVVVKVKPVESEDDGYWQWFEEYVAKRSAQRQLVNETRIKLSMLAKEIKSRRSKWFKLLIQDLRFSEPDLEGGFWQDFFTGGGRTEFSRIPAIRQDLKAKRDSLRSEINALRDEQKTLLEKALNETQDLFTSASTQFETAKETHPELQNEVDRVEEEQRLLKLELYDSAEWYAPHELTKHIKQYEAREGSLPEHLNLLHVRALIGEAEWLEEKVYMQRNSPSYQDPTAVRQQAQDNIDYWRQLLEMTKPTYDAMVDVGVLGARSGNEEEFQARRSRQVRASRGLTSESVDPGDPLQVVARSARFDAMMILRGMHQQMPDNQDILQELLQQELFFIQRIADKINEEQRASMMAFYGYLKERGFGKKDLKDDPEVTLDPLFLEQLWAGLGMGPIAALSAISADDTFAGMPIPGWLFPDDWLVNTADAMAEIVGDAQKQSAQNRVAINALIRMMKNGLKLVELPSLNPTMMAAYLVAQDGSGRSLPPERLRGLLRDIKEMMVQLPELGALVRGDLISFSKAFGRGHYPSIHPKYSWYEWFGDLFNAKNIVFLWGPGSVYSLNDKVLIGGPMRASTLRTGVSISAREKFVETVGLGRLSKWIAQGPVGKTLLAQRGPAALIKADKYLRASRIGAAYSLASSVGNVGANIANSMLLYGGASVLAQQYGYGPGAQLLIEAVAEIGVADLLADAMRLGGLTPGRIAAAADEISDRATKQIKAVETRNRIIDNVQNAATSPAKSTSQAKKIKQARKEAADNFPPVQGKTFPQDLAEASEYASAHATNALKKGDSNGVTRAAKAAKNTNEKLKKQAQKLDAQAKKAKQLAKQADAKAPPRSKISREELHDQFVQTVGQRMAQDSPYERFWAPKMHKETIAGPNLKAGDLAVRNGNLENALDHFTEARRKLIEAAEKKPASAQQKEMLELLDQRIAMILEHNQTLWARKAAKEFAGELSHASSIPSSQANAIAAKIDAKLPDDLAPKLKSINDDIEATRKIARERLEGVTDQGKRAEIIIAANKRIAQLESQKSQLLEIDGVDFFREGPGSVMWKVEHEGETFFVKYSLQGADKNALALDSTASELADALGINTFATKLNQGQRNPLLVSRGVDVGAKFSDLNDGEMLAYLDEYAEQRVFRTWLGDPDGHANNIMLSKDGDLLPFDFDRAHIGDEQAHTLYIGHSYTGDEQALMRGSVLWSHGSIGDEAVDAALDRVYKAKNGKSFRLSRDTEGKIYSAMARVEQMMSYKRLKKTVDKIKALTEDGRQLEELLEKGGWPDVETAAKVLRERASKLEDTLKPLFDKELIDGVPRIITSQIQGPFRFTKFGRPNFSPPEKFCENELCVIA